MLGYWNDFERTFAAVDRLRREVEQTLAGFDGAPSPGTTTWPRIELVDAGAQLVLRADVPGMNEKDVQVQLTQDVLTVSGERRVAAPEGYSVHRQERTPARFSRSFTLPVRVDGSSISAALKDGVLTVTMPKSAESKPRQITVKAL